MAQCVTNHMALMLTCHPLCQIYLGGQYDLEKHTTYKWKWWLGNIPKKEFNFIANLWFWPSVRNTSAKQTVPRKSNIILISRIHLYWYIEYSSNKLFQITRQVLCRKIKLGMQSNDWYICTLPHEVGFLVSMKINGLECSVL